MHVGDFIIYPAQGVGRVEAVETRSVAGREARFFLVGLLDSDDQILIPVARASVCGVRAPVGRAVAAQALDVFDDDVPDWSGVSWIRRNRHYEELLGRGQLMEVAGVLRDLLHMKATSPLSFGQIQLLQRASRMVVQEVALVCERSPEEVEEELFARTQAVREPPKLAQAG